LTHSSKKELDYIINLQTFKHELKTTLSEQQLLEFIFRFKFVLDMRSGNNENRSSMLLHRDPQGYFNYLEELNERAYIESPYVKYIIGKLSKTDRIRQLFD
jgi:hypothetical protein